MNSFIGFFVGIWTMVSSLFTGTSAQTQIPPEMPSQIQQTTQTNQQEGKAYIDQINAVARDSSKSLREMPAEVTCADTDSCPVEIRDAEGGPMSIRVPHQYEKNTSLRVTADAKAKLGDFYVAPSEFQVDADMWYETSYGDAGCMGKLYYRTTPGYAQTTYVHFTRCEGDGASIPPDDEVRQIIRTLAKG